MRWFSLSLLVLLMALQLRLWVGDESLAEVRRLNRAIAAQSQVNEELGQRNQRLTAEVADLKDGLAAVEERARRELGMIARDEVYYQLVD